MLAAFPLLLIALILANFLGLSTEGGFDYAMLSFTLPSGATVSLSAGWGLVLFGLVLLYVEIFKATRTGSSTILDHALSLIVFIVGLVELLVVKKLGHPVFMTILLMCLIDVIAGFTVSISGARRDFGLPAPRT